MRMIEQTAQNVGIARQAALVRLLADAGWHIDFVDLDLTSQQPAATIKCHRSDGRWLWARLDQLGRCSIDKFQRQSWIGRPRNAKGRWPQSPQVDDLFLGRIHPGGARAMLRELTRYLADNATTPTSLKDMRSAWAAVMGEPLRITAPAAA